MDYLQRMRDFREDADFSQAKVAAYLQVAQKTYSDYELGKTRIPLASMMHLAQLYQVSMDYMCAFGEEQL